MLRTEKARDLGKKLRLIPVVMALCALAAMSSGTAFAVSVSISPGYTTRCQYQSVNFSTSWSGSAPYDVDFAADDSGGTEFHYTGTYNTSRSISGDYDDAGIFYPSLWAADYGCGGSCGWDQTNSTVNVTAAGSGGCPLGPDL